jgi:anti-sigma regulatory factor (Ser/Thr protein kinase)
LAARTGLRFLGVVAMEIERRFSAEPASARQARNFAVDALAGTAADTELVRLLTSELATNAVLHAQTDFRVRVRTDPRIVRVEVINDEPELLLAMRDPSAHGGRGLHLVRELADDWGAESFRENKVVWFEVPATCTEDGPGRESTPYPQRDHDSR